MVKGFIQSDPVKIEYTVSTNIQHIVSVQRMAGVRGDALSQPQYVVMIRGLKLSIQGLSYNLWANFNHMSQSGFSSVRQIAEPHKQHLMIEAPKDHRRWRKYTIVKEFSRVAIRGKGTNAHKYLLLLNSCPVLFLLYRSVSEWMLYRTVSEIKRPNEDSKMLWTETSVNLIKF